METTTTKKRGRPKKKEVSKKTAQKRLQRERANMSQKQNVKQSVVVKIGNTEAKRRYTKRKKSGGGLPPASYQHNLAPTILQAPQVDYTPLLLALNRTPNPIQPPMPTINETTPLSVGVQTTEQELANNSTFQPIPLEMNRRPRSSFVSNSHLDRQVEAEPRAEIDYGFGNQQFFPRPRSESVVSDLTENSDSGFTPLTTPRFTPKAPRKTEILTSDEGSSLDDDLASFYLSTLGSSKSASSKPTSSQSSSQPSVSQSSYGITQLQSFLPRQQEVGSSIGSLSSEPTVSSLSEPTVSSVSTLKSSVASSPIQGASGGTKLGRPVIYSGSSVQSRVQPQYGTALSSSARQEAEIQALKKTFANYQKSNKLDKLKPSEIDTLLVRKGNKSRIDTLAKQRLITPKQYNSYYERYGYVSKPRGMENY